MWAAPLPPGSWTPLSGEGSRDDGLRDEQGTRDFDHRFAAVHRRPPQPLEGFVLDEAEARHQRALGALDHLAVLERLLELPRLGEPRDGDIERGRELLGTQRLEQGAHALGRTCAPHLPLVGLAGQVYDRNVIGGELRGRPHAVTVGEPLVAYGVIRYGATHDRERIGAAER